MLFLSAKLPKATVAPLFDPVLTQLLEKQNDGNVRMRDGARRGLDLLAGAACVGPLVVAQHALRPIPAKQKTAWRPLQARIKLLADLVNSFGLNNSSGLNHDTLLALPKSSGAFAHSSGEVREAAKELVVNIQRVTGTAVLEPVLKELRAKQREEYMLAFEGKGGAAEAKADSKPESGAKGAKGGSQDPRTDKHLQHAPHSPGGKVHTSAAKVANSKDGFNPSHHGGGADQGEGGQQDFTSCMFCGVHNAGWSEADLDVHYWKDCPLLISCPSCAQIVEIAGLPEHQLDECDAKDAYVPCEVTGKYCFISRARFNVQFVTFCIISRSGHPSHGDGELEPQQQLQGGAAQLHVLPALPGLGGGLGRGLAAAPHRRLSAQRPHQRLVLRLCPTST